AMAFRSCQPSWRSSSTSRGKRASRSAADPELVSRTVGGRLTRVFVLLVVATTACATAAPTNSVPGYRAGPIISGFAMTDEQNGPLERDNADIRASYVHGGYLVMLKVPGGFIFDGEALPRQTGTGANIRVEV